ncbi:MAG: BMP family ABC transporter substrate-binding protein [Lachnospiraceae bacterium]|nr:BMP family ABC transporter substrate-binding protein [Lachnospiraceae bacterium]
MKKNFCSTAVAVLCFLLAACGKQTVKPAEVSTAETTMEIEEQPERVFVLNMKDQNSDAFMTGVMNAFTDSNAILEFAEGIDEEDCKAKLLQACEDGYEYIVGVVPVIVDMIAEIASEYPETEFAIFDAEVPLDNVTGFYVDREDAYFEAGAIAAKMTTQDGVPGINEEMTIGWIGGMNLPIVKIYFTAFENGARSVEPEIQILEQYIGNWNDPEEGKLLAVEQFEMGADVILSLTDESTQGILEAADEAGFYVIDASGREQNEEAVLGSIRDDMEQVGYHMVKKMLNGISADGSYVELTAEDGCVVLDKDSKAY